MLVELNAMTARELHEQAHLAWPLQKIISGGQTGVDQAALRAAQTLGYQTGGYAPWGYKTEDGPARWLSTQFNLEEAPVGDDAKADYTVRTYMNVGAADGTLWLGDLASAGGIATSRAWRVKKKPHCVIECGDCTTQSWLDATTTVRAWIRGNKLAIVNVAGHRESTHPGVGRWAYQFLLEALQP